MKKDKFSYKSRREIELDNDRTTIDVLLAQWVKLSDRIENIENGHWQVFTLVIATFGLFSLNNAHPSNDIGTVYWIMPIIITVVITYEAYRLREQAILRRYLSKIEATINGYLEVNNNSCNNYRSLDNAIEWYSKYKIQYSSGKALAKRIVLFPVIIAILFIYAMEIYQIRLFWPTLTSKVLLSLSLITFFVDILMIIDIKRSEKLKYDNDCSNRTNEEDIDTD